MELRDTTALVTGGASGLGAATVRELASAGATVVIVDIDADAGSALAEEVGGQFALADVTDETSMAAAVTVAVEAGPLRAAVACAGICPAERTVRRDGVAHDLALFRKVLDINLVGSFNLLRLAGAAMVGLDATPEDGRGVVVLTSSIAAQEGQIGQLAYAASKGGVAAMVLPAARDLGASAIRVCGIAPGVFDTPLLAGVPESHREALAADVVHPHRLGQPSEFARFVRNIIELPYLNGDTIRLDGATRMQPR